METTKDSITTNIIATIDPFGTITFRDGACKAIEGIGIKDDLDNFYDAGISEDFTVYAGNVVDVDNSIITGEENNEKIPHFKVGDKLLLLSYYDNSDEYGCGVEINGIFDNWQSFKESDSYKNMKYSKQSTLFVRRNQYSQTGWNGIF